MAGASIAQAYQRSARLKASKVTRKPEQLETREEVLKARDDFPAFCTLMGKPPAKHMKAWHKAFLTGESNEQLLDIAGPNTAILAPRGPLDPELQVATPGGWRRLGDLAVGDQVFADDGTPTAVVGVVDYPETPCFEVVFSDGLSVICDDSHRWDVRRMGSDAKGEWRTVTLQEIRQFVTTGVQGNWRTGVQRTVRMAEAGETPWLDSRGYPRYQVPVPEAVRYPERDLPIDPYLLGVLIGDGALSTGSVRFHKDEPEMVERIAAALPPECVIKPQGRRQGSWMIVHKDGCRCPKPRDGGRANPVVQALVDLDLWGKRSEEKFIPREYLLGSIGQRLALLQGLLDTDGTCKVQSTTRCGEKRARGGVSFGSSSAQLIQDISELVRSLGGLVTARKPYQAGYRKPDGTRVACKMSYRIGLRLPEGVEPFFISRKSAIYQGPCSTGSNGGLVRSIVGIRPAAARPLRCITIAHESERFVADSYLSIKNSAKSTSLCLLLAWLIGRHAAAGKLLRVLYVSYNVEVARGKSAAIKNLICTPEYREVFPMVHLSKTRSSDELWCLDWEEAGIDVRGEDAFTLACAGLKGSITSKRSSLVVVDDAIKSAAAIANPDVRREMEGNWESVIVPTMFQGGRAIALGTRFHFDDLFATVFTEKRGWEVLIQQALSYDEDGRARSYWPKMWSAKYLLARQSANRISFSYQYQNQPVRNTELGVSPELFIKGDIPESFDAIGVGIDLSAGLAERNDWTVFTLAGRDGDKCYVIDYRRLRSMGNLEKIEALCELLLEWNLLRCNDDGQYFPTTSQVMIWPEVVAYQKSFEGDLKRMLHLEWGLHNLVVSPIKGFRGDKLARLRGMMGLLEGRKVIFNKYRDFGAMVDEIVNFGHAPHDDMADSLNLVVQGLMRRGRIDIEW